ncbi:MAG: two-component sensor histidine kinase [Gammaproteobacteria bacterium]|nr:two-component sensor histidine kinase [Gammaproteobacteria bacterium]|tara:strand:- start:635 stop:1807 length:1173 start_codon:yes stop_codon:yes gene_type:complete
MDSFWSSTRAQSLTGGAVLVIVSALSVYLLADAAGQWRPMLTVISTLFALDVICFVLFTSAWAENSRQRLLSLLWLQAAAIVSLYFLVDISFVAILGIVWVVQATEMFPIRTAGWLLLGSVSAFSVSQVFHWGNDSLMLALTGSVTLGLFHVFAMLATHRARSEQALREETAALNRELVATRELLSEHSRQSERLRIARDLHDLLGHHLTAQILQLEVATHITDGAGRQKVEQALALGKLLLSDLRTAVSELREDEPINFRDAVQKLVSDIPGITIELSFSATLDEIELAQTLLRCTREALTNVLRHSGASRCVITFTRHSDNDYVLQVQDNGGKRQNIVAGNGLKGIKERIEEAGGSAHWRSDRRGFLLEIRLPGERTATDSANAAGAA